jgi:hypothetical protein
LDKHPDSMGSTLRQLLHNLGKIDGRKKVTPRILCDFLYFFLVFLPIRKYRGLHLCVPRSTRHVVFRVDWLRILGEINKAIPEEAT